MGKKKRIKREKELEALREAQQPQANPPADAVDPSASTRRGFLKRFGLGLAGAGVVATVGGVVVHENKKMETEEDKAEQPLPEYLSVREAVDVYRNLQKTVEAKWQEAQRQHKPLRIFVLENHDSINAVAYKLMLIDIARKLGIQTLLPEIGSNTVNELLNVNPIGQPIQIINQQQVLQSAYKNQFSVENMDCLYATQQEYNQKYFADAKRIAEANLNKRYNNANVTVTIIPAKDINNPLFSFNISGNFISPLTQSQIEENGTILRHAREEAYKIITDERNAAMINFIKGHGSAVLSTGSEHGMILLTPLRSAHEIDIAFNVTDKKLDALQKNSPFLLDPEMKKRYEWGKNAANAIQYSGKDFSPQNITHFVDRVIERANSKGLSFP